MNRIALALLLAVGMAWGAPPLFEVCELYAPGHFGNSYEVMSAAEMRACLTEAKDWGFNRYADWFDMEDCSEPFASPRYDLAAALWDRKKENFRIAQELGLPLTLVLTPNHVYVDQCLPAWRAKSGDRIFGQLICPSNLEARAAILRNYENLFADLAKSGIRLDALSACPYDYGGCACDACQPWILTFAQLCREIHTLAERHHSGIEMHFIGWWWKAEEHRFFAEWVDREAPGWAKSMSLHIPYDKSDVSDVPLPQGCARRAFVHIGYADAAAPKDVYGHLGPVIAANRLERTVEALHAHGCTGVMAYSEGIYDDVNKALLGGFASGRYSTSEEVLRAYAKRYFGADDTAAPAWAAWLRAWGTPYETDAAAAAESWARLVTPATPGEWRLAQWEAKLRMMTQYARIGTGEEWNAERLAAADAFWREQDRMQRQVYGLGPQRHILNRRFSPFPWYKSWAAHQAQAVPALSGKE